MEDREHNTEVTWLASYPKSGNTWIRFLLSAYFFDERPRWDWVSRVVLEFPNFYGQAQQAGDSNATLWQRLLEIGEGMPQRPPDYPQGLFLKTHQAATADHPFLDRTQRAILVVRNPRDIAMSAINYLNLLGKRKVDDERAYLDEFLRHGGDPVWKRHGYGTWREHARSWLDQLPFPVLLIRYEDLHTDVVAEFEKVVRFIGAPVDHGRIVRAAQRSDFQSLRRMEDERRREKHLFPGHDKQLFMHRGRVCNSLAEIDVDLDRGFEKEFQQGMTELGYAA
jgi:aryl sulfotransferase